MFFFRFFSRVHRTSAAVATLVLLVVGLVTYAIIGPDDLPVYESEMTDGRERALLLGIAATPTRRVSTLEVILAAGEHVCTIGPLPLELDTRGTAQIIAPTASCPSEVRSADPLELSVVRDGVADVGPVPIHGLWTGHDRGWLFVRSAPRPGRTLRLTSSAWGTTEPDTSSRTASAP